jgi:phosphatidylglycerol lysyltransferase
MAAGVSGARRLGARAWPFVQRNKIKLEIAAVVLVGALGIIALHHLLEQVRLHQIRAAFHSIPIWRIAAALGFSALSYVTLTFYDVLALRIIGRPLPHRTVALASFTSYALSHNLGLALLTGGSARYRIYRASGLSAGEILAVIATAGAGFWAGAVVIFGVMLAIEPHGIAAAGLRLSPALLRWAGVAVLVATFAGIVFLRGRRGSLRVLGWQLPLPRPRHAIAQIGLSAVDLAAACGALFILAPSLGPGQFPLFFFAYMLGIIAGQLSHVPGGLGIFEAVMLALMSNIPQPQLVAALVAYRVLYYFLPLGIAALLVAVQEHRYWKRPLTQVIDGTSAVAATLAPALLAMLTFLGGAMLLVSGSLPAVPARLRLLRDIIPLPFAEASHIAASLAGTALLLIAPGLYRRQDAAFLTARALLLCGAVFSLVKGFDYEEATVLFATAALLQWTRKAFYRQTALTRQSFSPSWILGVAITVGLSLWIGFFSYKHIQYQNELWWRFAWKGDAPRFLRASFAVAVFLTGAALLRLFKPARPKAEDEVRALPSGTTAFAACNRTEAMLAYTGDKLFLSSPGDGAFLMYRRKGDTWIVMGDPVGPQEEWAELMWRMREMVDRVQGRLLFYQLTVAALPIAIDMGLQLIKYGEEARVDLGSFTTEGPEAKQLRYAERRAAREGAVFEIVPAKEVADMLPELRQVSNSWLAAKRGREKTFSIGHFDPEYLARFDCAVVRQNGRICAFANVWKTENREELSVDLMRHLEEVPYGTMDFLLIHLMRWGQAQGYRWFTLGLAPLSGMEARRLAPIWAKIGDLLFRHGEVFYSFEGLRGYKEKFSPVWEPRYIAGPNGISLTRALVDLQALISGGGAPRRRVKLVA